MVTLNRDIVAEFFAWTNYRDFGALCLVNKFFLTISRSDAVNYMDPLYDTYGYARRRGQQCGREYANKIFNICTDLNIIIEKKFQFDDSIVIPGNGHMLPDLKYYESDIEIIKEYYSFEFDRYRITKKKSQCYRVQKYYNDYHVTSEIGTRRYHFSSHTFC